MLKIKDGVTLEQLKKYGIKPIYDCDSSTGDTWIRCLISERYVCKEGYLTFIPTKKKVLRIFNGYINNHNLKVYKLDDTDFIDADLLYDLIKDDIVEKVKK